MKSRLLFGQARLDVERRIREFINEQEPFLSSRTIGSQRAVGDAIQSLLAEHLSELVGADHCVNYTADFPRRSMADMAFEDNDGCHYFVDVKTHRLGTAFNMPNLTSVERLARFYSKDANFFVVLLVSYEVKESQVIAAAVTFAPIEFLDWGCLTIGALGWGQIQIANASSVIVNQSYPRKDWMLQMCERLLQFYPRELSKIEKRIEYFREVQGSWTSKLD